MEGVAKMLPTVHFGQWLKPTNRDLKKVFWGRYDKHLWKYGTSTLHLDRRDLGAFRCNSYGFDQFLKLYAV